MKFKSQYDDEVRRFTIEEPTLHGILLRVAEIHEIPLDRVVVKFLDEDNDQVTLSNDEDLEDALELYRDANNIRLFVSESDLRLSTMIHSGNKPKHKPAENLMEQSIYIMPKAQRDAEEKKEQDLEEEIRKIIKNDPEAIRQLLDAAGFEMLIKENVIATHAEYKCDGCGCVPIVGARFSCSVCENFDICGRCERSGFHDASHPTIKYKMSDQLKVVNKPAKKPDVVFKPKADVRLFAKMVEDCTLPDRCVLQAGDRQVKIWKLLNSGANAWPAGCKLHHLSGEKSVVDVASLDRMLPRIESGESFDLELPINVPNKAGHFISYFRLIDQQGKKFGPRLWVDFRVEECKQEVPEPEPEDPGEPEQSAEVPAYESEMEELKGMGFGRDPNLNLFLLKKFDGSIQRVVEWHLSRMK